MVDFPSQENNTLVVSAFTKLGSVVTQILARDADVGSNAWLEFSIAKGNEQGTFEIDPTDGTISLVKAFPVGGVLKYGLVLVVRDSGVPEKSAEAFLEIVVNRTAEIEAQTNDGFLLHRTSGFKTETLFMFLQSKLFIILALLAAAILVILVILTICLKIHKRRRSDVTRYHNDVTRCVDDVNRNDCLVVQLGASIGHDVMQQSNTSMKMVESCSGEYVPLRSQRRE